MPSFFAPEVCVDREGIKDIRLLPSEIHVSVG